MGTAADLLTALSVLSVIVLGILARLDNPSTIAPSTIALIIAIVAVYFMGRRHSK